MAQQTDAMWDQELSSLVKKTEGLQPWRRVFHACNGLLIVAALELLPLGRTLILALVGGILLLLFAMDGVRLANPELNRLFFRAFSSLASPREARGIASSTWYLLGVFLTILLFPPTPAAAGILVLALADPAAGVVGRSWGKVKLGAGTVRGSATFMAVAFLIILLFAPWWVAFTGALITSVVEALPWPVDDNLTVPLTVAGTLLLLAA